MQFNFQASIECASCDNVETYGEVGEPDEFEYFDIGEFENNALARFKQHKWHRDDVLSDWLCPDCK